MSPAATRPSISRGVAAQKPWWPSASSRFAIAVDLNAFTCGRSFAPGSTASIAARFRSNVATSISNAGVTRSERGRRFSAHRPILARPTSRNVARSLPLSATIRAISVFGERLGIGRLGYREVVQLDLDFVRSNFPAFARPINDGQSFFENAGGSFACRQTIDALTEYYTDLKVQPYSEFESSRRAGELMDRSRERWAEALGVEAREVVFGPSTTANTYVLAHAFADVLEPGNEVIVTNQDHEANTGAIRRAAERVGCEVKEWRIDPDTGLLDIADFEALLSERTGLVTVPHASNIVGSENDVTRITQLAHAVGARVIVDGVSFAPHSLPDVGAIGADVYLFSLYKTYSVHQGLMVRAGRADGRTPEPEPLLQRQRERQAPQPGGTRPRAGGVGRRGARLRRSAPPAPWRIGHRRSPHGGHERLDAVARATRMHSHRCCSTRSPVATTSGSSDQRRSMPSRVTAARPSHSARSSRDPQEVAHALVERGVQTSSGHYYAARVLDGLGIDPDRGVVRLSFVHYTSPADVERAVDALADVFGSS